MAADKSELGWKPERVVLKGCAVSEGTALAPALLYAPRTLCVQKTSLSDATAHEAVASVEKAISQADGDLAALIDSFPQSEQAHAKIFAAHREILADEDLRQTILDNIEAEHMSADYAVYAACETFISLLKKAADETIALRAADVTDVRDRLLLALRGETKQSLSRLPGDCILVAHDLLPSDTASIDRKHVLGIVTEIGSETSHTAILARSFRIPALVGVRGALSNVQNAQALLLDAEAGELTLSPGAGEASAGRKKRARWLARQSAADACLQKPACTKDGERLQVGLNIGSDRDEIPAYVDFVGLFRTEFLYMNANHLPTEDEQFTTYRRVLQKAGARPVTLRTLDIGGDKTLSYMQLPKEENPFLGKRALRLCFDKPDLFATQLRAALRASAFGSLRIMFPMVGSIDDIRRAKAFVDAAKTDLRARRVAFDEDVRLGIMIEVPSIAIAADLAAREVDFASIGTNDLCQYLFAADRMNSELSAYCQPFAPAFLRVLQQIVASFRSAGKELSMCGELAGNPRAAALLAGLGLQKFSMSASSVAKVKLALSKTSIEDAKTLAVKAAALATQAEVIGLLDSCDADPAQPGPQCKMENT
mgnify:CR=1 FL=1